MNDLLKKLSDQKKEKIRKKERPEWAEPNKLSHPRYLGLRRSKSRGGYKRKLRETMEEKKNEFRKVFC